MHTINLSPYDEHVIYQFPLPIYHTINQFPTSGELCEHFSCDSTIAGPTFGFTKANELFVGRLAQLGIAFSIIGEIITGKGTLAQLNLETGVPITEIEPLILFNVVFFLVAAINPGTGKFVNDDDVD